MTKRSDEGRLRTILDSMVEAARRAKDTGADRFCMGALDQLVAEDVRGRRAKNVIKSEELRLAVRRARKKNAVTEVELESSIGDRVHVFRAQVAPLPRDEGVVTVLHDVTSLKNADRMRRDFVANASHELRTPLTAIRGFAETLRDGALSDPQAAGRFIDAILRHTLRMQRLAEDLGLLSQAESAQANFELTEVDLKAACSDACASFDRFARESGIVVKVRGPRTPVRAVLSARALDHILTNLIENAIKYSPSGTEVIVRIRRKGESVFIEVVDQGPGIPVKYQKRVFERFYRVDKGRSREEGGTGLGLSIARRLAMRMGGSLELESKLGAGSTFRLELPIESPDANQDVSL